MNACPACGHQNLQSAPSCVKCGSTLGSGLGGVGGGAAAGDAEYQKLLRDRAAAKKMKQTVTFALVAVAVVAGGFFMWKEREHKAALQVKLDFIESWVAIDRKDTAGFWNCVTQTSTMVDQFSDGTQVQGKIEIAYMTQPKTFPEMLRSDCGSKADRAQDAARSILDVPEEFADALTKYHQSIGNLKAGIVEYADRLDKRKDSKSADDLIQEFGAEWHTEYKPTPNTIAFDKFLKCAVPDLQKLKDVQGLLEFLAEECYKKDAVAFMKRVREECGEILTSVDGTAKAPKDYKATMSKFFEDEQRMITAWGDCSRKSSKGGKSDDLTQFLHAMGEHMQTRANIAKIGRELQEGS